MPEARLKRWLDRLWRSNEPDPLAHEATPAVRDVKGPPACVDCRHAMWEDIEFVMCVRPQAPSAIHSLVTGRTETYVAPFEFAESARLYGECGYNARFFEPKKSDDAA